MLQEKVQQLVTSFFEENPEFFLIDFTITPDNKIKIVIDGDNGVTLNDCVALSRHVEHNLDRESEDFALEVTSAGATTPLQHERQYKKNKGRILQVKTTQGEKFEGTLQEATTEHITLTWKAREPKPVGKGKVTVQKTQEIALSDIKEAKVIIKF